MNYPRLAARVFNTPLLVTPEAAATVANVLGERMGLALFDDAPAPSRRPNARAGLKLTMGPVANDDGDTLYDLDGDGVATIAVHGELVNRGSWMDAMSGLTSYKALAASLDAARDDYRVRGIVLDIDSPGGEAAGAMEAAAHVRAVSAQKKVVAYIDSLAASAAYAIASGADEIVATPSATLGSIGVVFMHLDRSEAMKDRGLKPTILHAGAYKIDGNSMQPLPEDARARIQGQIDQVYGLFLDTVGKHRPALGAEGARKTEAGVFFGQRAVDAGLADRIGGLDALKSAFPRKSMFGFRSNKMATHENEPIHTQAALEAAVASARRDGETAAAAAATTARSAERDRIRAILDHQSAKGRQTLARHLALSSDMAPEAAQAVLAAAAPEAAAPASRMDRVPDPVVRPGATQRDSDPQADIDAGYQAIAEKLNKNVPAAFRKR